MKTAKKIIYVKGKKVNLNFFFLKVDEFFSLVGKRDCNLLLKGLNVTRLKL